MYTQNYLEICFSILFFYPLECHRLMKFVYQIQVPTQNIIFFRINLSLWAKPPDKCLSDRYTHGRYIYGKTMDKKLSNMLNISPKRYYSIFEDGLI